MISSLYIQNPTIPKNNISKSGQFFSSNNQYYSTNPFISIQNNPKGKTNKYNKHNQTNKKHKLIPSEKIIYFISKIILFY